MIKVSSGVQIDILNLFLKYEIIYLNVFVQNLASIKPGFKYLYLENLEKSGNLKMTPKSHGKLWNIERSHVY